MFKRLTMICTALCLAACGPLLTLGGAPPQLPAQVTNISRGAIDFALNSFDAALYGFDLAMDLGKPKPGSPEAKRIAAVGRKVMAGLAAVEAARDAGNSASYELAFQRANTALTEFRTLIRGPSAFLTPPVPGLALPSLGMASRGAILERASG